METIIYAIGAVVVLGIVAFFVLKKLQTQKINLPTTIKPDTKPDLPPKQTPVVPPTPTPTANSDIAVAEAHISNQNYQEAISELKRILMINPRHSGAMLKLLQTYGITKQYHAFNQLHQKIHEIADGETIREADFCKSLLEEELSELTKPVITPSAAAVATTSSEEVKFDKLDFDIETPVPVAPTIIADPVTETSNEINNFDFDFDLKPKETTVDNVEDSQEFDLDFDTINQPNLEPLASQSTTEPTLDFDDLNFDEPSNKSTSNDEPTLDFDVLLVDGDNQNLDDESKIDLTFSANEKPVSDKDDLDTDLVFDFDDTTQKSEDQTTQDINELFEQFEQTPSVNDLALKSSQDSLNTADDKPEEAFDFDFDINANQAVTSVNADTSTSLDSSNETLEVFDFDATTSQNDALALTDSQTATDFDDVEFTFDINKPSSDDLLSTVVADGDKTDDLVFDGFDEELSFTDAKSDSIIESKTEFATQTLDLDLDLDLNVQSTPNNDILTTPNLNLTDQLTVDELDLDATDLAFTKTETSPDDSSFLDNFELNDLEINTESQIVTNDIFDLPEIKPDDNLVAATDDEFFDVEFDTASTSDEVKLTDVSVIEAGTEPTSEQDDALFTQRVVSSEINLSNELNDAEITLNLAKQYLDLGEYDSAKRLLNEVIQTGDANQQQNARTLMVQMI